MRLRHPVPNGWPTSRDPWSTECVAACCSELQCVAVCCGVLPVYSDP